jgi:hypothetical protein
MLSGVGIGVKLKLVPAAIATVMLYSPTFVGGVELLV